jgi:hypothetical protein
MAEIGAPCVAPSSSPPCENSLRRIEVPRRAERRPPNTYQPVMRPRLATPDEKKTATGYTSAGPGVTEVERPWCLQPVYQPDPRTAFRHHSMLPPRR